jgi:hypothetical protein
MNAIQQLATRVKAKADVSRWLARPNNGTTDAYQQHLDSFANQFHQTERTPADIMASFDEYHGGAE